MCGRPSGRTVVSHDSSVVARTSRAGCQSVADACGSLYRLSKSARGVRVVITAPILGHRRDLPPMAPKLIARQVVILRLPGRRLPDAC